MRTLVFILMCWLGCLIGYLGGGQWVYQYELTGEMEWSGKAWEPTKIIVRPRHQPPVGLWTITTTVLSVGSDGYWYADIGGEKIKFERVREYEKEAACR